MQVFWLCETFFCNFLHSSKGSPFIVSLFCKADVQKLPKALLHFRHYATYRRPEKIRKKFQKNFKETEIENLEKKQETQTKLVKLKLNELSEKNFKNGQQLTFDNGETKVLVNAKMFVDTNKSIADMTINLKYLEQDVRNEFLEKKKIICLVAAKLVKEHQVILRNRFEKNLIFRNWKKQKSSSQGC